MKSKSQVSENTYSGMPSNLTRNISDKYAYQTAT